MLRSMILAAVVVLSLGCVVMGMSRPLAEKEMSKGDDVIVAVEYFAGWWDTLPNKWNVGGSDWRERYPNRVPVLGEYNTQEVMDAEIAAASEYGVDAFMILWYYVDPKKEHEGGAANLNRGLTNFIDSPNAERMSFVIEFCNHPPFDVSTIEDWDKCIDEWMPGFKHPSCLRVDGKIVFKVHGAHYFYQQLGNDVELCKERLTHLRNRVRDAGLGEMLIGGGVIAPVSREVGGPDEFIPEIFDFTMTYMWLPTELELTGDDYSFDVLTDFIDELRRGSANNPLPSVPYAAAGWNPEPWVAERPKFSHPTREQFRAHLTAIKEDMEKTENFGLPLSDGGRQKMVTIYAWNEFGEGGFVAPTKGDGYMKLEVIKEVFGTEKKVE